MSVPEPIPYETLNLVAQQRVEGCHCVEQVRRRSASKKMSDAANPEGSSKEQELRHRIVEAGKALEKILGGGGCPTKAISMECGVEG